MSLASVLQKRMTVMGLATFTLSLVLSGFLPALALPEQADAQACTPVSMTNLDGHWKFDEGTGTTTADSSGNGHTGTLNNGPTWSTGTTLISPNPAALQFDGADDNVSVANSTPLQYGTGSFSVSLFARTNAGNRAVLGNFNGSNRGWGLYFYNTNRVNFFAYGASGINDTSHSAPTLLNNQWHHVAGVFTRTGTGGNSVKIDTYLDGTLIGTNTTTVGNIASASPLLFGDYLSQPNYLGRLDDIRVYGRTLNATEIASLAAGCSGSSSSSSVSSVSSASSVSSTSASSVSSCATVSTSNLNAYYKFDEATGTGAIDSTAFNNQGTLLNGALRSASAAPLTFTNTSALQLDGTNDYVLVPDTTGLPSGSNNRTIALWMNQTSVQDQSALVSLGNGTGTGQKFIFMMGTSGGQTYVFTDGVNASNNITLTGSHIPTTGAWHHVAFVTNGTQWGYYLDGSLKKTGTFAVPINTNTNDVEIGARHDSAATGFFQGRLDDVRIYGRVLTGAEVAALANGCGQVASSASSASSVSSISSVSSTSSVSSVSSTSSASSASSTSSVSSTAVPMCNGQTATIYVQNGMIVGGPNNGQNYNGLLYGTNGADVIVGTQMNDFIRGQNGNDTICGRAGNDFIQGDEGSDTIFGQQGNDVILGNNGADRLFGGADNDRLFGSNGADTLCGNAQNDYLDGSNAGDDLDGGNGTDTGSGGNGNDTCANVESPFSCNQFANSIPACSNVME